MISDLIGHKGRNLCLRCLRAEVTCYCKHVRSFRSRFQLVLLQHPREYRNSIGTARITHHCIENSKLIAGAEFDQNQEVNQLLADPKNHCIVLYPGLNSINISQLSPAEIEESFPVGKTPVIFIIDGTWNCAKKMLIRSPKLNQLPQICFTPETGSNYRIRKQPDPQYLSTIEATHRLLTLLDPAVNPANLLEVFEKMVDRQIEFFQP